MAVESESFTELTDEFALVAETAAEAGVEADAVPRVRRGWVNVPAGGHVSGVFWGEGPPELVFLHDIGGSARRWDDVALAVRRPESGGPALRREVLYELLQEPDGAWTWRHHWGNQPPAPGGGDAAGSPGEVLWDELGRLGRAATVIRGDEAGALTAADLGRLGERAPGAAVVTVPGAGADITAQPAALAVALVRLLTRPPAAEPPAGRLG